MLDSLRSNPTVRGLAALYAGTFLSGAWAIIIPTIPVLAREFGVSAGGAAQIVTAFAVGKFVGTVIAGIVLDRMGTRIALVGGPMVASIAALGAAWVPWFIAILALALVMGAADSLWATAREIAGIDLAPRHQRGRVISSLHGTYSIGTAMGPLLGGWLTDVFSFKAAFAAYAIATALSVFLGLAGPDFPVAPAAKEVAAPLGGWGLAALKRRVLSLGDLFKKIHPDLRATYLALCLATLSSQSQRIIVQSMLPLYAGAYLQLSPTQIGMLFTIAQGLSLGSVATSTYDVVPAHVRGRLQAVRRTVAELGSGLAPLFGGYLANTFNPGVPFLFYAPLLAMVGKEPLER
jgi:MFS family permease